MLCIQKDLPGKQLYLETTEKPYASVKERLGCFTVMLLILVVAGGIGYVFYETHSDVVLGLSFVMSPLILLFLRAIVFPEKEVLSLHANDDSKQLKIALGLPGYQPRRTRIAAFADIEMIRFVVPQGIVRDASQDIPFELWVHSSKRTFKEKVKISGINTDVELSDLLLRLANIIQLSYYRVVVNDPQRFEICTTRVAEQDSQPVPEILGTADYTQNIVADSVTPPPQVIPGVGGVESLPPTLKALVWTPGQKIELVKRWRVWDSTVLGGSLMVIAGMVLLWIRPDLINTLLPVNEEQLFSIRWTLLFPICGGGIALVGWVVSGMRYRCQLDFTTGQAKIRLRGGWKQFNLAEVHEVVLVREQYGGSSTNRANQRTTYRHRLEARLHNGDLCRLMLDRRSSALDQCKQHYNELWSFAATLADFLNVPARYED